MKDPYTQENLETNAYPAYIAQGSLLNVTFKEISAFNEENEYSEVLLVIQCAFMKFMLVSFNTGNRWLSDVIQGEKNGTIKAIELIKLIQKTPNCEILKLRLIGHLTDIDLFSFLAATE